MPPLPRAARCGPAPRRRDPTARCCRPAPARSRRGSAAPWSCRSRKGRAGSRSRPGSSAKRQAAHDAVRAVGVLEVADVDGGGHGREFTVRRRGAGHTLRLARRAARPRSSSRSLPAIAGPTAICGSRRGRPRRAALGDAASRAARTRRPACRPRSCRGRTARSPNAVASSASAQPAPAPVASVAVITSVVSPASASSHAPE